MLDKNGAGYDPRVEDVNPPRTEEECELCGGECVLRMTVNDEQYYKCLDCGNIS